MISLIVVSLCVVAYLAVDLSREKQRKPTCKAMDEGLHYLHQRRDTVRQRIARR